MRKLSASPPGKEKLQLAFGAAMKHFRLRRRLTQERLAERADLHTNYVSSVERGERNVSLYNIARIAFALDVTLNELLEMTEHPPKRRW